MEGNSDLAREIRQLFIAGKVERGEDCTILGASPAKKWARFDKKNYLADKALPKEANALFSLHLYLGLG